MSLVNVHDIKLSCLTLLSLGCEIAAGAAPSNWTTALKVINLFANTYRENELRRAVMGEVTGGVIRQAVLLPVNNVLLSMSSNSSYDTFSKKLVFTKEVVATMSLAGHGMRKIKEGLSQGLSWKNLAACAIHVINFGGQLRSTINTFGTLGQMPSSNPEASSPVDQPLSSPGSSNNTSQEASYPAKEELTRYSNTSIHEPKEPDYLNTQNNPLQEIHSPENQQIVLSSGQESENSSSLLLGTGEELTSSSPIEAWNHIQRQQELNEKFLFILKNSTFLGNSTHP